MKKALFYLIFLLIGLLLALVVGELTVRLILNKKPSSSGRLKPPYDAAQKDDLLGWKMTPNYTYSGSVEDAAGDTYPVEIKYDDRGYKVYGNPASEKKKILFIGDSYTASIEVSNSKSFFSIIQDSLQLEVFAYGQSGWGNLQQYLFLKNEFEAIQPDMIIWQVCSNDFMDNYYVLEMESSYQVNERRPYLNTATNEIEYIRPITTLRYLARYSALFNLIHEKWNNIWFHHFNGKEEIAEYQIAHSNKAYTPYQQSYAITSAIFEKVAMDFGAKTQIVGFSADVFEPQYSDFRTIFEVNGLAFYNQPPFVINKAKSEGQVVHVFDHYHWNEQGHQLIAKSLMGLLEDI